MLFSLVVLYINFIFSKIFSLLVLIDNGDPNSNLQISSWYLISGGKHGIPFFKHVVLTQRFSIIDPSSWSLFRLTQSCLTDFPTNTSPPGKQDKFWGKRLSFPLTRVTWSAFQSWLQSNVCAIKTGNRWPRFWTGGGELNLHNVSGLLSRMMTAFGGFNLNTSVARRRWRLRHAGMVRLSSKTELEKLCGLSHPVSWDLSTWPSPFHSGLTLTKWVRCWWISPSCPSRIRSSL